MPVADALLGEADPGVDPGRLPQHALHPLHPPNSSTYDCLLGSDYGWKTAWSRHLDGVNVRFGVGPVKFDKGSVNVQAWRALATRNGGEVVDGDAYRFHRVPGPVRKDGEPGAVTGPA